MPGMSGLDVLHEAAIQGFMKDTRFYILTGGSSQKEVEKLSKAGATDVYVKPIRFDTL